MMKSLVTYPTGKEIESISLGGHDFIPNIPSNRLLEIWYTKSTRPWIPTWNQREMYIINTRTLQVWPYIVPMVGLFLCKFIYNYEFIHNIEMKLLCWATPQQFFLFKELGVNHLFSLGKVGWSSFSHYYMNTVDFLRCIIHLVLMKFRKSVHLKYSPHTSLRIL